MEISYEPDATSSALSYASFSRRFGALVIDWIILGVMGAIAGCIVPWLGSLVVWFFYAPIFESSEIRATVGKQLMGIQVVDLSGRRLTFRAALIRNLMKLVSSAILLLGYVFALFSSRRQTLHDLVADSVVVYGRSPVAIVDAWTESAKELFRSDLTGATRAPSSDGPASNDVLSQLERLRDMRDRGELTAEQYEAAKEKILRP